MEGQTPEALSRWVSAAAFHWIVLIWLFCGIIIYVFSINSICFACDLFVVCCLLQYFHDIAESWGERERERESKLFFIFNPNIYKVCYNTPCITDWRLWSRSCRFVSYWWMKTCSNKNKTRSLCTFKEGWAGSLCGRGGKTICTLWVLEYCFVLTSLCSSQSCDKNNLLPHVNWSWNACAVILLTVSHDMDLFLHRELMTCTCSVCQVNVQQTKNMIMHIQWQKFVMIHCVLSS